MSIKVIDGTITHNNVTFESGSIISGLSEKEETRLISLGFAEKTEEVKVISSPDKNVEEIKKIIETTDSIEELEKLLALELKGKNRKTVIPLLEDKLNKLSAQNDDHSEDEDPNKNLDINFNPDEMIK